MGTERLLLVLALGLLPCVAAADTMRCGSALISEGDTIEKVLDQCGEPRERTRTWIQRPPRFEFGGQEIPFEGTEDVPVDVGVGSGPGLASVPAGPVDVNRATPDELDALALALENTLALAGELLAAEPGAATG